MCTTCVSMQMKGYVFNYRVESSLGSLLGRPGPLRALLSSLCIPDSKFWIPNVQLCFMFYSFVWGVHLY